MNNIVTLIGGRNVGKSSILRSLCCIELNQDLKRSKPKLYLDFNGERILTFILSSSPQESTEYCNFDSVIERLKKFVKKCGKKAGDESVTKFLIIIAFTLQVNRGGELGKDCIANPLDFLKSLESYKIHVAHVNRDSTRNDYRTNEFI
ncbi:MAG: hypothetical protein IIC69_03130, partial [Nanoarchaeota archaeon]|nr:hypothetical protein [Nanoarchaeota archaeon]